jgi:hypothetical protein
MAVTARSVRALKGAITRPGVAGGAVAMGDAVYINSSGQWVEADANVSAVVANARGIVVAVNEPAETTAASGDAIEVCVFGPVGGFSALTPAARQFLGNTAGELVETAPTGAGTWTTPVGYAESATILFVNPGIAAPVSNS